MTQCVPDWRWLQVEDAQRTRKAPEDVLAGKVYDVLRGKIEDSVISHAVELFSIPDKRDTLTAFLLCRATPLQIEQGVGFPPVVSTTFEKIYLDPTQFKDKIDVRSYGRYYRSHICQKHNRMQIEKAITDGPFALLAYWALGNELHMMSDEELASRLLSVAMAKVSTAAQASVLSPAAKEGLRWAMFAAKVLETRNRLNPVPADADELLLDLKQEKVVESIGMEHAGFDLRHLIN